jgi:3-hydroxyacyl-CoA dehydrogenase
MSEKSEKNQKVDESDDLRKRLKIILGLREKVSAALDKLYNKGDITPKQVSDFLDNPKNFPAGQFETIQKSREDMLDFIWDVLGKQQKETYQKKTLKKKTKKMKRRSLGHRRKWLKMD